jgi:hypothetical protein
VSYNREKDRERKRENERGKGIRVAALARHKGVKSSIIF